MQHWLKIFTVCTFILAGSTSVVFGTEVLGSTPGDGGDANLATFHFEEDNTDLQLTKPDGTAVATTEVTYEYGTSFGIYEGNTDYVLKNTLKVIGANLTGSNWVTYSYPPKGNVAIDPANGRFKFATLGSWQAPEIIDNASLETPNGGDVPKVVVNESGKAIALWIQSDGTNARLFSARYEPGTGWYAPVTIDAGGGSDAATPDIAINDAGYAVAVFLDIGASNRIYAVNYNPDVGWYQPVTIDAGGSYSATNPKVAMNSSGDAMVGFIQPDATAARVYVTHYDNGPQGWYGRVTIQANANDYAASAVDVDMDNAGNALAVFTQIYDGSSHVGCYANRFTSSGWQGAIRVDAATTNNASVPNALMSDNGAMVAMFEKSDGSNQRVYANHFSDTSWQITPQAVDTSDVTYAATKSNADINANGEIMCVFLEDDASGTRVWANHYVPGTGWYTPVSIDAQYFTDTYTPYVVLNDYGHAICHFGEAIGIPRAMVAEYLPSQGWQKPKSIGDDFGNVVITNVYGVALNNAGKAFTIFFQVSAAGPIRVMASRLTNAVPDVALNVNYHYLPPTPTPTSEVPGKNVIEVTNRKLQPNLGQTTTIHYAMQKAGIVSIKIYNLQGELVRVLEDQYHSAGTYTCQWAGRTMDNVLVASGVYIIHVKTPSQTKTQKVVVIK